MGVSPTGREEQDERRENSLEQTMCQIIIYRTICYITIASFPVGQTSCSSRYLS